MESLCILAFSTGPNTFERSLDLLDFLEVDRRLFAMMKSSGVIIVKVSLLSMLGARQYIVFRRVGYVILHKFLSAGCSIRNLKCVDYYIIYVINQAHACIYVGTSKVPSHYETFSQLMVPTHHLPRHMTDCFGFEALHSPPWPSDILLSTLRRRS